MGDFERAVREGALMLTDGGIETHVIFETDIELPENFQVAALVGDPAGGPVLRGIYGSYIDAARSCGLPVIIGAPLSTPASISWAGPVLGAKRRSAASTATPR